MANRTKIKAMAMQLGLGTVATGHLKELGIGNLDYLQLILEKEIESRKQNTIAKVKKFSNLPNVKFDREKLNEGLKYQVDKLLNCDWIGKSKNLLIVGKPNRGKTALASYLATNAIEQSLKVFYVKMDELITVLKQQETLSKARATFGKIKNADLLVLDEILYLNIANEDLELLYKAIMKLNETVSIIFISNREISSWYKAAEDKYTMQLLISRALADTELIML